MANKRAIVSESNTLFTFDETKEKTKAGSERQLNHFII